jgi:hypothetical protein
VSLQSEATRDGCARHDARVRIRCGFHCFSLHPAHLPAPSGVLQQSYGSGGSKFNPRPGRFLGLFPGEMLRVCFAVRARWPTEVSEQSLGAKSPPGCAAITGRRAHDRREFHARTVSWHGSVAGAGPYAFSANGHRERWAIVGAWQGGARARDGALGPRTRLTRRRAKGLLAPAV